LLVSLLWVSDDPILQRIFDAAKTDDFAYNFTRDLTTELGPRLAGSRAEAKARQWTQDKFEAAGLSNVRTEAFPIMGWGRRSETFRVNSPFGQKMFITALGGSVATPQRAA